MNAGLKGCKGENDCLGGEGVLRVSLGCFVSCLYEYWHQHSFEQMSDPNLSIENVSMHLVKNKNETT